MHLFSLEKKKLMSKVLPSTSNELIKWIKRCINVISFNDKIRVDSKICEDRNVHHVTILFHIDLNWKVTTKLFLE